MFNRIVRLLLKQRKRGVAVLAPNKYALSVGMKTAWSFDLDQDDMPIFHSASEKAKWEMCTGEYSFMFDKFITK